MSGLARILIDRGFKISGSDPDTNEQTLELSASGAKISTKQVLENITADIDTVVITSAIRDDNPELVAAKKLNLNIISRSVLLNEILASGKAIAVTGTHGKTTTSSMLASALTEAGLDPTSVIGAEVQGIGGNAKEGKGEYSVAEVCEYERAFLDIYPFGAIITNIEADHLDYYKDIDDIVDAFAEFVSHLPKDGFLVYMGANTNCQKVAKGAVCRTFSYGLGDDNDFYATDVVASKHETIFNVYSPKGKLTRVTLQIPGEHNILNCLAVLAVSDTIGADIEKVVTALGKFTGAKRRFQIKLDTDDITIIDDYAHHPTEIEATLAGVKQFYPKRRIVAVFQPHQHSRTRLLLTDFANAFTNADVVLMPEIYAVRDTEEDINNVSSRDIVRLINKSGEKAKYCKDFEECQKTLKGLIQKNDVVITIGAGPVYKVGEQLCTLYTQHID